MKKNFIDRLKTLLFVTCCSFCPALSYAGTVSSSNIINPTVMPNGQVIFSVTGARSGSPSCATVTYRFAFDSTTPAGRSQLALLLTAYAMGKTVLVYGNNSCSVWSDTETMDFLQVNG